MCGKSCLTPGFDPRTVQLVGRHYTDYVPGPRTTLIETYFGSISLSKLATCKSWTALNVTKGGQYREVSLYSSHFKLLGFSRIEVAAKATLALNCS